jgi:hypothetical protein
MESLRQRFDDMKVPVLREHQRPTDGSVSRVNEHFSIRLPAELVQLAKHSKYYPAYFLSLGPDYQSHCHIIRVNSYWRRRRPKRRIPRNLVVITQGYMDDRFWCLDTSAPTNEGDYAVQFWCPEPMTWFGEPVLRYPSFAEYIEGVIKWR